MPRDGPQLELSPLNPVFLNLRQRPGRETVSTVEEGGCTPRSALSNPGPSPLSTTFSELNRNCSSDRGRQARVRESPSCTHCWSPTADRRLHPEGIRKRRFGPVEVHASIWPRSHSPQTESEDSPEHRPSEPGSHGPRAGCRTSVFKRQFLGPELAGEVRVGP